MPCVLNAWSLQFMVRSSSLALQWQCTVHIAQEALNAQYNLPVPYHYEVSSVDIKAALDAQPSRGEQ